MGPPGAAALSKRTTRRPGDEPPPSPERGRRLLALRPLRTVDTWKVEESSGCVVLTHAKALGRVEARLLRLLRGSPVVRRHLDEYGSAIWILCDGRHTVEEIARALEQRYHEAFEPALPRTLKFVEILAQRNLVAVEQAGASPPAGVGR